MPKTRLNRSKNQPTGPRVFFRGRSSMAESAGLSESVLIENPNNGNTTNVPSNDTGTAHNGISVARQPCKKMNTTMTTNRSASNNVLTMSFNPSVTERV